MSRVHTALAYALCALWLLLVACSGGEATAGPPVDAARLDAGAEWLLATHQNADGGFSSFSQGADLAPSDVNGTLDAMLALAAAGRDPGSAGNGTLESPLAYLEANPGTLTEYAAAGAANAGKAVLALTAAGADPRAVAGGDLVAVLSAAAIDPTARPGDPVGLAFTILGLAAAGETAPPALVDALVALQAGADAAAAAGSWDDGFGTIGNVDATALAVMSLRGAAPDAEAPHLAAARAFLQQAQLPTGGFAYAAGLPENANSTALAVQALRALDEPYWQADGAWAKNGRTPLAALLALQGESGAFQADFGDGPFDDFFATVQALPAVAGRPYPLPTAGEDR